MRHETTIVYQKCLQLMETARERRSSSFPPGFAFLADELRRNTSSVSRSFAEGYYYDSKRQQRRHFGYAIQSAREASASFDTARSFRACRRDHRPRQVVGVGGGEDSFEVGRVVTEAGFSSAVGRSQESGLQAAGASRSGRA